MVLCWNRINTIRSRVNFFFLPKCSVTVLYNKMNLYIFMCVYACVWPWLSSLFVKEFFFLTSNLLVAFIIGSCGSSKKRTETRIWHAWHPDGGGGDGNQWPMVTTKEKKSKIHRSENVYQLQKEKKIKCQKCRFIKR